MKNIALILVTLLFITSCQKRAAPLVFESKSIQTDGLELCKEGICPIIAIEKVTASGNETFAETINAAINQVLINNLVIDPDEEPEVETFDQALTHFISSYRIYKSDFPDAGAEYEINSVSEVSHNGAQLLSIKFENYTYWGGAHGYGSTTYVNCDKDTQTQLSNEELFKDYEAFLKLAGSARSLLTVERPALNFIQTLSAVATKTAEYVQHLEGLNTKLLQEIIQILI